MTSIRKSWYAALVLSALVGCTKPEEPPTTNPPTTAPGPAPETPPPATEPAKSDMKPEATPSDTGKMPEIEGPKVEPPKKEGEGESKEPGKTASVTLSDEEVAEIKKLPADEQTVALKQAVCPVSKEHLGEMGMPVKVSAEGKTFYLCCKSCNKEVVADPKGVVANLNQK